MNLPQIPRLLYIIMLFQLPFVHNILPVLIPLQWTNLCVRFTPNVHGMNHLISEGVKVSSNETNGTGTIM